MFADAARQVNDLTSRQVAARTLPHPNPPLRLRAGEGMSFDDGDMLDLNLSNDGSLGASSPAPGMSAVFGPSAREIQKHAAALEERKARMRTADEFAEALRPVVTADVVERVTQAEVAVFKKMSGAPRGSVLQGLSATGKGLVVPYEWFGRAMNLALEGIAVLRRRHIEQAQPVVDLAAEGGVKRADGIDLPDDIARHLECSELEGPFDDARTAVRVATLWRMLVQVSGSVPGMDAALRAFEGLLPIIYDGFAAVAVTLPPVTNLAAQIEQLAELPTKDALLRARTVDAAQLGSDVHYIRSSMQNWAFQIWYKQMLGAKRRNTFLVRVGDSVQGLVRKTVKRTVFMGWRQYTAQTTLAKRFRAMREAVATNTQVMAIKPGGRTNRTDVAEKADEKRARGDALGFGDAVGALVKEARMKKDGQAAEAEHAKEEKRRQEHDPDSDADGAGGADDFLSAEEIDAMRADTVGAVKQLDLIAEVCRAQLDAQREEIRKLVQDRDRLGQKTKFLEGKVLEAVRAQTSAKNDADRVRLELLESKREIARLQSRIALQEHHAWRDAAVEVTRRTALINEPDPVEEAIVAHPDPLDISASKSTLTAAMNMGMSTTSGAGSDLGPTDTALRDWVNHCLADLTSIERGALNVAGTRGGPGSLRHAQSAAGFAGRGATAFATAAQTARATALDDEFRDGVVLSRLLFYLGLPRYTRTEAIAAAEEADAEAEKEFEQSQSEQPSALQRRRSYRMRRTNANASPANETYESAGTGTPDANRDLIFSRDEKVSLHPLSPHYVHTFHDFATMPYYQRAEILVEGAAELLDMPPSCFDPIQLAEGFPHAIRMLLALLFVRFAHPMQHKAEADLAGEVTGEAVGLVGLLPPLSTTHAKGHTLQGKFWSPTFLETSEDLSAFMHFFTDLQQSLSRYKWHVTRELIATTIASIRARDTHQVDRRLARLMSTKDSAAICMHIAEEAVDDVPARQLQQAKERMAALEAVGGSDDGDESAGRSAESLSVPQTGAGLEWSGIAPISTEGAHEDGTAAGTSAPSSPNNLESRMNTAKAELKAAKQKVRLRRGMVDGLATVLAAHHKTLTLAFNAAAIEFVCPDGASAVGVSVDGWRAALYHTFMVSQRITMTDGIEAFIDAKPSARNCPHVATLLHVLRSSQRPTAPAWTQKQAAASTTLTPRPPSGGKSAVRSTLAPGTPKSRRATREWGEGSDGSAQPFASQGPGASMRPADNVLPDDSDLEPAFVLDFAEFVGAIVRIAALWAKDVKMMSAAATSIDFLGRTSNARDEALDATVHSGRTPPSAGQTLAGIPQAPLFDSIGAATEFAISTHWTLIATRSDYDNFLDRLAALPVQKVLHPRLVDLQSVFHAYSRLFAEDYAMDVGSFVKALKDGAVLTADFPATAASELFQSVLDHEALLRRNLESRGIDMSTALHTDAQCLYGTACATLVNNAMAEREKRRSSTASNADTESTAVIAGPRTRHREGPRGVGVGVAASLQANLFRVHNFVQALAIIAEHRVPSPFKPLPVKIDGFCRSFLDAIRPKIPHQIRSRNAAGASVPLPRGRGSVKPAM